MSKTTGKIESLSYEQAMKELQEITAKLTDGNLPLDDMIALYERGNALGQRCLALLDAYQARIDTVSPNNGQEE